MSVNRTPFWALALFLSFFAVAPTAWAQNSTVEETELQVQGVSRKGQRIFIKLDSKVVEKAWGNHLKQKAGGTVKGPSLLPNFITTQETKGIYTVEKGKLDTITQNPVRILSKVEPTPEGTMLWWTLDMGNAYLSQKETAKEWAQAEAFLQRFARQLYKEDVQQQITDAEKVVVNSQANADRVARQAQELKDKIAKNQQQKLQLEAALAANAQELVDLNLAIENNLLQQQAAQKEVENMRHAVEIIKGRLDKIN